MSVIVINGNIEVAKGLQNGQTVQLSPDSMLANNINFQEVPGVDYTVVGQPEFFPEQFRCWGRKTDRPYRKDNVIVTLTDGERTTHLAYTHLL